MEHKRQKPGKCHEKMDLRKERTLKNLSSALVELLHEKTLEQISVSELCDRAMVRRATFYRHFKDKNDLLEYVVRQRREKIAERTMNAPEGVSLETYCHIMSKELVKLVSEHRIILEHHRLSFTFAQEVNVVADEIGRELSKRIALSKGFSEPTPEISITAAFYASGLMAAIRWWVNEDSTHNEENLLSALEQVSTKIFA